MTSIWEIESLIRLKDKLKNILIDRRVDVSDDDNLNTLVDKVNRIGNNTVFNSFLSDSISNYYNDEITSLKEYAFYCNRSMVGTIELPNIISIGMYALSSMPNVKKIIANKLESFNGNNTCYSSSFEEIEFRNLTRVNANDFIGCNKLKKLYIPKVSFNGNTCISSTSLEYVCVKAENYFASNSLSVKSNLVMKIIIINYISKVVPCTSLANFPNYALTEGDCYIYVPRDLLESYKIATNWSTYADRFRAIEDYKNEICEVFPLFEEDYAGTWDESEVLE